MRQRFIKSGKPFDLPGLNAGQSLREIFLTFHSEEFKEEILFWLDLSLANDRSVYQEASDREDVIDFCRELVKLTDAFYQLSVQGDAKSNNAAISGQRNHKSGRSKKMLEAGTSLNSAAAAGVILHFRSMFSQAYVELELCDLLDAVITYDGVKHVSRENMVLFYQCVRYLVHRAYAYQS